MISKVQLIILAGLMILTGAINTMSAKFQDKELSVGLDGNKTEFNHPAFQSLEMMIGESTCMAVLLLQRCWIRRKQPDVDHGSGPCCGKNRKVFFLFCIPAIMDLTATTMMFVGLTMTSPSVYQMLRGFVVVFTAIFSIIFLRRRLMIFHWVGVILIVIGCVGVGIVSILGSDKGQGSNPLVGNLLVIGAQVIVAVQFIFEESRISKYNVPPLQVVGSEGCWGVLLLVVAAPALYFIPGHDAGSLQNFPQAIVQMANNWKIILAVIATIVSIAFFNGLAVTITKHVSSAARATIDSTRTILIWVASVAIGYESFLWQQLIGFAILVVGTLLYNEIIPFPKAFYCGNKCPCACWRYSGSLEGERTWLKTEQEIPDAPKEGDIEAGKEADAAPDTFQGLIDSPPSPAVATRTHPKERSHSFSAPSSPGPSNNECPTASPTRPGPSDPSLT
eukprot:gnl/Trimastix_PCT/1159.p1 GENE.gnl/Trimastix_PCT/1159~~gnl/Trimastix_PCT/1159.p1  ORF type:complete len:448 (+),score=105.19 gnl/Trimastix_PCT/1159:180-1523(+)